MASKEFTRLKHQAIRTEYTKWDRKRYKGIKIYTDAYIFMKLSEKFYLSPNYIEHIVYGRTN